MNFNILTIYIIFIFSSVLGKKIIQLNKILCEADPEIMAITTCEQTKSDEFPNGAVTVEVDAKQKIEKLYLHVDSFKLTNGEYKPHFVKFDTDLCPILAAGSKGNDLLSKLISNVVKKLDTNVYHKCPFEGVLYAKNLTADAKDFAMFESLLMPGTYRLEIRYFSTKQKEKSFLYTEIGLQVKDK